ncbi:MAG: GspH/FimT family protein [Gammaproteobacteria bacterium]|nr:GspH/FimT family protein [Gammaproteobacteria bacterium]
MEGQSSCASSRDRTCGFSLLELLVVLVIAAVVAAPATPALNSLRRQLDLSAAADTLLEHLNRARSHAVTGGRRVTLCPLDAGGCGGAGHWSQGWMAFEDHDADGARDSAEPVLVRHRNDPDRIAVAVRKTGARLYYRPTGYGWPAGTFRFCAARGGTTGHAVIVALNGRARRAGEGDPPVDCALP